eukprot:GSA120T00000445001.1
MATKVETQSKEGVADIEMRADAAEVEGTMTMGTMARGVGVALCQLFCAAAFRRHPAGCGQSLGALPNLQRRACRRLARESGKLQPFLQDGRLSLHLPLLLAARDLSQPVFYQVLVCWVWKKKNADFCRAIFAWRSTRRSGLAWNPWHHRSRELRSAMPNPHDKSPTLVTGNGRGLLLPMHEKFVRVMLRKCASHQVRIRILPDPDILAHAYVCSA